MNAQGLLRLAQGFVRALEEGDLAFLERHMTADVVYDHGESPNGPVRGKEDVLARMEPLLRAFPGWHFNARDFAVDEDNQQVRMTIEVEGTNSGEMDFRTLGLGRYPATGRSFRLPPEPGLLTMRGASVCLIKVEPVPGGGFTGVFEQLGPHR